MQDLDVNEAYIINMYRVIRQAKLTAPVFSFDPSKF